MQQPMTVERNIWIAASREKVWRAITDPQKIEQWFSPGARWQLSSLEVGGVLSVYDEKTDTYPFAEVLLVVDPPTRLVLRSKFEPPYTTTYQLIEEKDGTRLLVTYVGYEAPTEDAHGGLVADDCDGISWILGNIKAVVEGTELPNPAGF